MGIPIPGKTVFMLRRGPGAEAEIVPENQVTTLDFDVQASPGSPGHRWSSRYWLRMIIRFDFSFRGEGIQQTVPFQSRRMIKYENVCFCVLVFNDIFQCILYSLYFHFYDKFMSGGIRQGHKCVQYSRFIRRYRVLASQVVGKWLQVTLHSHCVILNA